MISYVAQVLHLFATVVRNTILLASLTGKLIISLLSWISSVILGVLESVALFFQIVYEDNAGIITEEIPGSANAVVNYFVDQTLFIWNILNAVGNGLYFKFSAIITTITQTTETAVFITRDVLLLLKKTVILFGDSIWLVITFIPVHLPQLIKVAVGYITNRIVDGYMALLALTNFLTEVPLESFVGLLSAILFVRLSVHFRERILSRITSLYWSLVRNFSYFYHVCYNYLTNSEVRVITRMSTGGEIQARDVNFDDDNVDDSVNQADRLCVICQERLKCVLTLPCRHVCLCTECCRRLYGYQRTCPLCRTFIYHSVTVYL